MLFFYIVIAKAGFSSQSTGICISDQKNFFTKTAGLPVDKALQLQKKLLLITGKKTQKIVYAMLAQGCTSLYNIFIRTVVSVKLLQV